MNVKFFALAFVLIFSACFNSPQTTQINEQIKSKASAIQITPTPLLGQKAKVQGEYQPIKIADNLKDSVEQQGLPNIWLEFEQGNGKILKIKLDDKFNEKLKVAGEALLHYQYVINNSENPDERYNASYNHSVVFINALNELREAKIDAPDERKKLTEDEAKEILHKQAGLINDRYFELDDYFKPKSAFYTFKKSINEKLGHQIF